MSPRIPDSNGISDSKSSIPDSKDMDNRFSNHTSSEFWNPHYFTSRDHHIVLKPCFSIADS